MKRMCADMTVPAASVSRLLDEWLDKGIMADLTIRRCKRNGEKVIRIGVYGSTRADIDAKIKALESLMN